MRRATLLFYLIIGISLAFSQSQDKTRQFSNYHDMREYFGNLYQQEKYSEAAAILETHINRFPDHLEANAYNLALSYVQLGEYKKTIEVLQHGLDHSVWFNIYAFEHEVWIPVKKIEVFKKILDQNDRLRQQAQKLAKSELLVVTPEEFNENNEYPLFIALHGGGSNIENFKKIWISEKMKKEFITAYVQSSLIVGMNRFTWTVDMEITKKEIKNAYSKIIKHYPIGENEVIIGGFSAGGVAALEIALSNSIPVTGFLVLCPGKPESFDETNIIEAKMRGIRGTILTSEMDPRLSVQQEMVEVLRAVGLQYQFMVTPNIGHWFPEDLDIKIDNAIDHIRYR